MFNKLGRGGGAGGGRGGVKRPPPAPAIHRGGPRPPIAARGGARPGASKAAAPAPAACEETFRLESRGPLDFASIIKLTPDLVEEIRRAEAQGAAVRIRFAATPNNPGSVINVGGKEFHFMWSEELGACDIYEEHRNGEDGRGLLVECGSPWRKLNVQRILDESTSNHLKMRSEEAERLLRSRKSIVLDPANPSVKNPAITMAAAAVEGSMRRMGWNQNYKKWKVEPNLGSAKSVSKSVTISKNHNKGMHSVSPLPYSPEQLGGSTSNLVLGAGNSPRGDAEAEGTIAFNINKDGPRNNKKDTTSMNIPDIEHKGRIGDKASDLRCMIITLLSKNPKGMSLKALEKAVGEKVPNCAKKIESILKNVANFQAPGRYLLKPGVVVESSNRRSHDSGSSSENTHDRTSVAESIVADKSTNEKFEPQTQLSSQVEEESDLLERTHGIQNSPDPLTGEQRIHAIENSPDTLTGEQRINDRENSPDLLTGEQRVGNETEGRARTSSESGSDSDSESDSSDSGSDSGSQSRSRSKSRSPVGSESGSSSDSDSEGTSNSKEGSDVDVDVDVDVDIVSSDDEKADANHKKESMNLKSSSPRAWTSYSDDHEKNDINQKTQSGQDEPATQNVDELEKDDEITRMVEITQDFPASNISKASETNVNGTGRSSDVSLHGNSSMYPEVGMRSSPSQNKLVESQQASYLRNSVDDTSQQPAKQILNKKQNTCSSHHEADFARRTSKTKLKRASDTDYSKERPESVKRPKAASSAQAMRLGKSKDIGSTGYLSLSPDIIKQDLYKDDVLQTAKNVEPSAQPLGDPSGRKKPLGNADKSTRYVENLSRGNKLSEGSSVHPHTPDASGTKNVSIHERNFTPKNKLHKDMQDENDHSSDKYFAKNSKEGKGLTNYDTYNRNSDEHGAILKDVIQPSQIRKSDNENSQAVNMKRSMLRREPSDLELGEFREPPAGDEALGNKREFERKGSFKTLENKFDASDKSDMDVTQGRNVAKSMGEMKKKTSPNPRGGFLGDQDEFRRRMPANDLDPIQSQERMLPSHYQPSLRALANMEDVSQLDKSAEITYKNEGVKNGRGLENHAIAKKNPPASILPQHENRHGGKMDSKTVKESKPQKLSAAGGSLDCRNGSLRMENHSNGGMRESSSDEDDFFYKYDKDEPELKGAIKDFSQYKEYVQEYQEKYGHYCSLNQKLENIRDVFLKLGQEMELAKVRDLEEYYNIGEQVKEMYRQQGEKQKQMKKVFLLLHEELKNLKQKIEDFASAYEKE